MHWWHKLFLKGFSSNFLSSVIKEGPLNLVFGNGTSAFNVKEIVLELSWIDPFFVIVQYFEVYRLREVIISSMRGCVIFKLKTWFDLIPKVVNFHIIWIINSPTNFCRISYRLALLSIYWILSLVFSSRNINGASLFLSLIFFEHAIHHSEQRIMCLHIS